MAAAISPAIISSRCSQPALFHSKLFLRSSSVFHGLSLSAGYSVIFSHAIKGTAPRWGTNPLKPIQCKVKPPARGRRFRIITDKPGADGTPRSQMYEYYIQTLAIAVGSKDEAKKCIGNISYEKPYGFECEIDEEASKRLKGKSSLILGIGIDLKTRKRGEEVVSYRIRAGLRWFVFHTLEFLNQYIVEICNLGTYKATL